jgi:hypothetical protein|tara:strand:- start:1606 stop:2052 length:447 start_codon:yes stop_codon:yes gene_type:complete
MQKPATIFDHINHLTSKKKPWEDLSEADQKSFSPYIINRWLSMHMDIIELVDIFQQYTIGPLSKKHVYQLYYDILPKANVRAKYIKGKKADKYNSDLVTFVKGHYETSRSEAEDMIDILILTNEGIQSLIDVMKMYGKTEKEIKKLLK